VSAARETRVEIGNRLVQTNEAVLDELHECRGDDRLGHRREEEVAVDVDWLVLRRENGLADHPIGVADSQRGRGQRPVRNPARQALEDTVESRRLSPQELGG